MAGTDGPQRKRFVDQETFYNCGDATLLTAVEATFAIGSIGVAGLAINNLFFS